MTFFKKATAFVLATLFIFSGISAFAVAQTIKINGAVTDIPAEMGVIKEQDDRTFVPVRFVMENLGCSVNYIDETQTAIITSATDTYLIQEGNSSLFIPSLGNTIKMDTSAFIEDVTVDGEVFGRMYVPIRFLAEAIGYDVGWDEVTQTVTLTMSE